MRPSKASSGKGSCSARPATSCNPAAVLIPGDVVPATPKHGLGQVDTHDAAGRAPGELEGDPGGAGGDVKDARRTRRNDVVDHCPPPASVLAEREDLLEQVVALRETGEELPGEALGSASGSRADAGPGVRAEGTDVQ